MTRRASALTDTAFAAETRPGGFAGLSSAEWCAVVVAVIVASLPAVMPAMVGAMADQPGIGTEGAGYLVSINMAGIFAGSLVCALVSGRSVPQHMIVSGLLVMMFGNLVTIAVTSLPALLAARLLSGLGEGFAAGVCYSLMAASRRPASTLAFYACGQAIVGAVGMGTLPWLVALLDWRAFYIVMTVVAIPALFLAKPACRQPTGEGVPRPTGTISKPGWLTLGLIFTYFTGISLIWAFLQRIGILHGLSLPTVSAALASGAIAGLAGSLIVALGGHRLSDRSAMGIGIVLVSVSAAGLWMPSPAFFVAGAWALNFAWGFQYPFLFRKLAATDPGRGAAVTPVATGIALSVGPALGGWILAHAGLATASAVFLTLTVGALLISLARSVHPVLEKP